MTRRLVTEARPIQHLSGSEQARIDEADDWITAVVAEAGRAKPKPNTIDRDRTGRVLFINGARGAGKTSILLTLLDYWTGTTSDKEEKKGSSNAHLEVFLPVLDFDPLPPGMPLHGWLLEPWRRHLKDVDETTGAASESMDVTERFAELFERAVTGWASASADGKGIIEKAVEYQEQTSGWIETHELWHKFVGAMLCRKSQCHKKECEYKHQRVFVIAIDDVDLQVERIPSLLHALRLFHHPNVAYVLTGNYEHLQFVLKLDYIHRHGSRSALDDALWDSVRNHSDRLCEAFLEKALPRHAMLSLPYLSFNDLLAFAALKDMLRPLTSSLLPAGKLAIVTARQAQHAADRLSTRSGDKNARDDEVAAAIELLADLCGTRVAPERDTAGDAKAKDANAGTENVWPKRFTIRGELTTQLGPISRVWKGDRLKITLRDQPTFAFYPNFDYARTSTEVEAHRALLVQLLSEGEPSRVVAHALEWTPVAGVFTTQVEWIPGSTKVGSVAVFHWPWLIKPTAVQTLRFGAFSAEMSGRVPGNTVSEFDDRDLERKGEKMLIAWLLKSIEWANGNDAPVDDTTPLTFDEFTKRLDAQRGRNVAGLQMAEEVNRWARELLVMATPYFGLPSALAKRMSDAVRKCVRDVDEISDQKKSEEQRRMVEDAILNGGSGAGHGKNSHERESDPGAPDLDVLTTKFLEQRRRRLSTEDEKSLWIKDCGP